MEDMDTYSMISQRIVTDDIFSIVDSYFMPYGIECDQYSIMGEILDFMTFKNIITGEEICQLTLDDYECYTCEINLDEDEMVKFITGNFNQCPYFKMGDEYRIVRKQM